MGQPTDQVHFKRTAKAYDHQGTKHMRTTIALDDDLIEQAEYCTGITEKAAPASPGLLVRGSGFSNPRERSVAEIEGSPSPKKQRTCTDNK